MQKNTQKKIYFSGPLNIDREAKRAFTVLGVDLPLDESQFAALDMLAMNEGAPVSSDSLFEATRETDDSLECRQAARESMNDLIAKVRQAGEGLMWIDTTPEGQYTFHTMWRRDLHKPGKTESHPRARGAPDTDARLHIGRLKVALIAAAGLAAAILLAVLLLARPGPGVEIFEGGDIPLDMPDFADIPEPPEITEPPEMEDEDAGQD